eukprot:9890715-Alexandrium_andersonii.AAC.1
MHRPPAWPRRPPSVLPRRATSSAIPGGPALRARPRGLPAARLWPRPLWPRCAPACCVRATALSALSLICCRCPPLA